jgi:hypothetical protein
MRMNKVFSLLTPLLLILGGASPATAGALFPCVKASSSSKGNFFVLTEVQTQAVPGNPAKVRRVSLQIYPRETFSNDKFTASVTHWTDLPVWTVVLEGNQLQNETKCPLALITDDGEFLVLVHINSSPGDDHALQIYRRRDHLGIPTGVGPDHGIFIRPIALKELWPAGSLGVSGWDDTIQWFAGGNFEFSSDSKQLVHKTRWGNAVRINLQDGSVSPN